MRSALSALLLVSVSAEASVAGRVRAIIESKANPVSRASWGVAAYRLGSGRRLVSYRERNLFTPASNTKLFSTALALRTLGAGFRYRTRVVASATPDADGRLAGDIWLVGSGDPSFGSRLHRGPDAYGLVPDIEELADQVVAAGVRRIVGGVLGDDRAYEHDPYPPGWEYEDTLNEDGPPVSALTICDNVVRVQFAASGQITPSPAWAGFAASRQTTPAGWDGLMAQRLGPDRWLIRRNLVRDLEEMAFPMYDPAAFAAGLLREALVRRGVQVEGESRAVHLDPDPSPAAGAIVLAAHESPPLLAILQATEKQSQNLHAELLLREVARSQHGIGTRRGGLRSLAVFLAKAGIGPDEVMLSDGSGLSPMNLISHKRR